jgi:hypothetical protein
MGRSFEKVFRRYFRVRRHADITENTEESPRLAVFVLSTTLVISLTGLDLHAKFRWRCPRFGQAAGIVALDEFNQLLPNLAPQIECERGIGSAHKGA